MLKRLQATEVAWHIINHEAHGYSQPNRAGDGTIETLMLSDGTKANIHGGDYDCSELVRACYAAVGVLPWDSYMWTGNQEQLLKSHGFIEVALSSSRLEGDVLWRSGHTELYLGDGKQGGARIAETGGINGAKGDQTGREITASAYKASDWTKVFRYAQAGWVKAKDGRWWYQYENGSYPKDQWLKVSGKWYFFDKSGWMVASSFIDDGAAKYYVNASGAMVVGWCKIDGFWYYFNGSGAMLASTCLHDKGKWYALGADGRMLTSVKCDKSGAMLV